MHGMLTIREKMERFAWCRRAARQLAREMEPVLKEKIIVPAEPGGWWHQYVCLVHHTELIFDPYEQDAQSFRCPYGCVLHGEPYRSAWLVYRHQELARTALAAASLYAAGYGAVYADTAIDIITAYAQAYPRYPVHPDAQPWMLKGRAFHQALTEAIWSTTLIRAYLLLRDEGASYRQHEQAIQTFFSQLENSMSEYRRILIEERNEPAHNYTAWLNACLSCLYAVRSDRKQMMELVQCRGGLYHHLSLGVRGDQLEFEGSTYYHLFVLRAYLITAEMAERTGVHLFDLTGGQGQSFRGMLDALCDMSAPNGELPALHDGPYQRKPFARETAEVFEIGISRYGDSRWWPMLLEAYRQLTGAAERSGLEAVLYGQGEEPEGGQLVPIPAAARTSRWFASSGFVVGRHPDNRLSFLADYGPHGGSHGHDDKLNLVVMHTEGFVVPERGMVPYGSALRKEWFKRTQSHNTVTVGGKTQHEHAGQCLRYVNDERHTYAWLRSVDAYPGAVLDRHLYLNGSWLLDWFSVTLAGEDWIEWWMHWLHGIEEFRIVTAAGGGYVRSGELERAGGYVDEAGNGDDARSGVDTGRGPAGRANRDGAHGTGSPSGFSGAEPDDAIRRFSGDPAYKYLKVTDIRRGPEAARTTYWLSRIGAGRHPVSITLSAPGAAETLRLASPGTASDPQAAMDGILQRQRSGRAQFVAVFKDGGQPVRLAWMDEGHAKLKLADRNDSWTVMLAEDGLAVVEHEPARK